MKKRKTYEISVIDKTYSKTISDETKFYTSDTALELVFKLKETEYTFESAEIVLLNIDDRSLTTRPVSKVNNDFVYELDDDIIPHYGEWHGQLRFEAGETYVSSPVKFRVENDLGNARPPQLSDVQSWVSLKRYADGLVDELKQAVLSIEGMENTFNANETTRQVNENARIEAEKKREETVSEVETRQTFVENQFSAIQQDLTNKDIVSAPEIIAARGGLPQLEDRLNATDEQLAQKPDKGDIGLSDLNKNKIKYDATWFSEDFLEDLANGEVNTTYLEDGGVTTSKLADNSVTRNKVDFLNKKHNLASDAIIIDAWFSIHSQNGVHQLVDRNLSPSAPNAISYVVPVKPNQTYSITPGEGGTARRYALANKWIEPTGPLVDSRPDFKIIFSGNTSNESYTLKTKEDTQYMYVFLSANGYHVPFELVEGLPSPATLNKEMVCLEEETVTEDMTTFFKRSEKNLWGRAVSNPYVFGIHSLTGTHYYREPSSNEAGAEIQVMPVSPNTTYTFTPGEGSDRNRYAISNDKAIPTSTSEEQRPNFEVLFQEDGNDDSFTFTTKEDTKFFYVYLSFVGKNIPSQLEVGEEVTQYEPPMFIKPDLLLPTEKPNLNTGKNDRVYQSEKTSGMNGVLVGSSIDYIYGKYDDLMAKYPQLITDKRLIGYGGDEEGNVDESLPIYEYKIKPLQTTELEQGGVSTLLGEAPTMIMTSGVHGDEKSAVYGLYAMFEQMLKNPQGNELVNKLKSSYQFKVVPIMNPWGYNNNTRLNARSANINRDFTYKGGSLAEVESQLLYNWLDENRGVFAYFDFHNFATYGGRHETTLSYHISPNADLNRVYDIMIRELSLVWKDTHLKYHRELGDVAYGFNLSEVYKDTSMTINEAYHVFDISLSATPESVTSGVANLHSNNVIEWTVEVFMNYLLRVDEKFGF